MKDLTNLTNQMVAGHPGVDPAKPETALWTVDEGVALIGDGVRWRSGGKVFHGRVSANRTRHGSLIIEDVQQIGADPETAESGVSHEG